MPSGSTHVAEAVPHAAYGEDVFRRLRVALELLSQVADVDVDGAGIAIGGVAPHARQQLVAAEHAAGIARERAEDLELYEREPGLLSSDLDGAPREIDHEAAGLEPELLLLLGGGPHVRPPQRRLHPGAELPHREGLRDVVVGAQLEPHDLV